MYNQGNLALKQQQMQTLAVCFPQNLRKLQEDIFEIPIQTDKVAFSLIINLGGEFPMKPPLLQVMCKTSYQHPFLDHRGVVLPTAHPKMQNWTARDNLGKMIYEILPNLTNGVMGPPLSNPTQPNQPPPYGSGGNQPLGSNPSPYGSNNPPPYGNVVGTQPPYGSNNPNSVGSVGSGPKSSEFEPLPVPKVPTSFPVLQDKSVEELQFLLSDQEGFQLLVEEQEFLTNIKSLRDDIVKQTEEAARKNLSKEEEMNKLSNEIQQLRQVLQQTQQQYELRLQQQMQVRQKYSIPLLLEKLRNAAHDTENESDQLSDNFFQNNSDPQGFFKEYMSKRSLFHLRSAKLETIQKSGVNY